MTLPILFGRVIEENDKLIYEMDDMDTIQELVSILSKDEDLFIIKNSNGAQVISSEGKLAKVKDGSLIIRSIDKNKE